MKERIQKILSARGVASRRNAEAMILAGRVTCNGKICSLGESADPALDVILLDGKPIPSETENIYIMLNKPRGYVTTMSDEKGRRDVSQLICDCPVRVYPVGRLDMDSEGLLLFTNDGKFANHMMHPSHEVKKTYHVWVTGFSTPALLRLEKPIILDGYTIRKPSVKLISQSQNNAQLHITIHEGRNRQVRRMCAAAGMDVIRLVRIQEGDLTLGDLPSGKWRRLNDQEIAQLKP